MRLINKSQRGFTLIELLVAIAITGLITGGLTMTIFQVLTGNARTSNHMTAVRQVQNAGYWVSRDAQMAQSVEPDPDPDGFPLTLTWTDWDGDGYQVVYTLVDDKLQREHYTNRDIYPNPDATTLVAQYIDPEPAKTNCDFAGGVLTLTVTASLGGDWQEASETRIYEVVPRPDEVY